MSTGRPRPPGIGNEHIDAAPFRDDSLNHALNRLVIADIELDAQSRAARSGDFGDRALGSHVFGFRLELFIRPQIEIGDRDLCPQPGQPSRIGAAEPARRAGDDRHLAVEFAHMLTCL